MLDTRACGLRQTLPMTRFINIGLCQKEKKDPNYQSGLNPTAHTMYFSKYMQNIHHSTAQQDEIGCKRMSITKYMLGKQIHFNEGGMGAGGVGALE